MVHMRWVINCALAGFFLVLGGAVLVWLIRTKPEAPRQQAFARVLEVAVRQVVPRLEETPVVAHGTVRPKNQVDIIPQVNGKLVHVHEDLAPGKLISEGELLFEIDPTVYKSRVRQGEAEIRRLNAMLARHDQELVNLNERVANVERMLAIDEQDYLTSKQLLVGKEPVGTQRDVDQLHLKYLQQKDAWVELTSRRSLIPLLKQDTQAQLDIAEARLEQSQYQLDNTRITCPFRARVERSDAYKSEVVTAYFSIAKLTDMEAFEIAVGVDPRELKWLDSAIRDNTTRRPVGNRSHTPVGNRSNTNGDETGPPVEVRWSLQGQEFSWRGRVTRFERVDEVTRTVRMVVEVRAQDMIATVSGGGEGANSHLSIGMYCRTELPIEPLSEALLVPRHAIYENRWVYVFEPSTADPDGLTGRLGRRQVPMLRSLDDSVLVDYRGREGSEVCELRPGDQIVVSPLSKPVVGMEVRLRDTRLAHVGWALPTIVVRDDADSGQYPPYSADPDPHKSDLNLQPRQVLDAHAAVLGQIEPIGGGG